MSWVDTMRTLDHPPLIVWVLMLKEMFFVLLIFKVWSGDWLGRKGFKKEKKRITEGKERKGGSNPAPHTPRPDIKPKPRPYWVDRENRRKKK